MQSASQQQIRKTKLKFMGLAIASLSLLLIALMLFELLSHERREQKPDK